ncbi:2-amino-4-oxopentanoate thiolase subunit OrtA [Clostridium swellfunianum]|uniref:2-amino-4-oxopentanoate thiolase subunit OrtA n=1 Tax=Clostridium swellfunianum TaxID=1367462 RepID=UPI00202F0563|nr:2-amino-4-oxopentanoate thiolase subunit OrtA [Clostridium swellfunianum]MCM0648784.1 2-amino-4-oxopentanoate thiolase subunit OrtA [Clostridium swellfunianum]
MIPKGSFVEIEQVILEAESRAENVPKDTKKTSLKLWAKGWLLDDAEIGSKARIKTVNRRTLEGILIEVNPRYSHDFGEVIPEVAYIGVQAKKLLWGDDDE